MKSIDNQKKTKVWTIVGLAKKYGVSRKTMGVWASEFGLDLKDVSSIMDFAVWLVMTGKDADGVVRGGKDE